MCGMHGMDVWVAFRFDTLVGEGDDEDNNLNADDAFCEASSHVHSCANFSWLRLPPACDHAHKQAQVYIVFEKLIHIML